MPEDKQKEHAKGALNAAREASRSLRDIVRACCPTVIVIEQVVGKMSHYPAAQQAWENGLRRLPYRWRHGTFDPSAANLPKKARGCRQRNMQGWVGVRV